MSYQQVHAGKVKLNGLAGIRHHLIDRKRVKTNPDIDLSRSHLNHSIEDLSPDHLIRNVRQRIKQLNLKRNPRIDAVGLEDIVVGASVDFMLQISAEKREQYFADSLHFFQNRYGKENVMYCQCHLDESNPHIHIGIVPVTSDGRLSARDLFNPQSLQQLQTDFHNAVAKLYGLERGESHSKTYLELNQFKAQQAELQIQHFSHDLQSALLTNEELNRISHSVHFATDGILFKTENRNAVELPTHNFNLLKDIAEQGVKAQALLHLAHEQNKKLAHDLAKAKADYDFISQQLNSLAKATEKYCAIPIAWRELIDLHIEESKKTFAEYCHDLNRATLKVYLASNRDFPKTSNTMRPLLKRIGISNSLSYVAAVINAAKLQHLSKAKSIGVPASCPPMPSWKPPKPVDTDYSLPDSAGIVPLQLSDVPDIDWNMINWDLLSDLDKDHILHKKFFREL